MSILETINLSKHYMTGKTIVTALSQVNLNIEKGEFILVIGQPKSGKSTLLHLLCGVEIPTSGTVIISGISLSTLDEPKRSIYRRRKIGYIFNIPNLLPYLSVEENIAFQLLIDNQPVSKYMVRLKSLMALTKLGRLFGQGVSSLSTVEQHKVAVVRSLVHQPEIILADEPGLDLDECQRDEMVTMLVSLCRQQGITLVMTARPFRSSSHPDRTIFLQEGRIIPKPDTTHPLLSEGNYRS